MGDKMGVGADFDSPSSVDEKLLARPRQAGFRSPSTGGRNPRRHLKRRERNTGLTLFSSGLHY